MQLGKLNLFVYIFMFCQRGKVTRVSPSWLGRPGNSFLGKTVLFRMPAIMEPSDQEQKKPSCFTVTKSLKTRTWCQGVLLNQIVQPCKAKSNIQFTHFINAIKKTTDKSINNNVMIFPLWLLFHWRLSLKWNACAQLETKGTLSFMFLMVSWSSTSIAHALTTFCGDIGIPNTIIRDRTG